MSRNKTPIAEEIWAIFGFIAIIIVCCWIGYTFGYARGCFDKNHQESQPICHNETIEIGSDVYWINVPSIGCAKEEKCLIIKEVCE